MICTSIGDIWTPADWPRCLFDRAHRSKSYVAYNLKYDSGALLQHLPREKLSELRKYEKTEHDGFTYKVVANKLLSIRRGTHYCNIFDMLNFYHTTLDSAAEKYLGDAKIEQPTKKYTKEYVTEHWESIAEYCLHDADLVARLAKRIIDRFEEWGMRVRKLYSVASVSYQWFSSRCGHPSVEEFWLYNRRVLDMAMSAYSGGKFEVTRKGSGEFWEYDLVSAYPSSIANLVDLHNARVVRSKAYRRGARYAFLDCLLDIPPSVPSPVAVKHGLLNTYPVGQFRSTITRPEYDYLIAAGADVTILDAVWIHIDEPHYLYRKEVKRLFRLKAELKKTPNTIDYHLVKILLNSLYGKFLQLIPHGENWIATASWNPIYGAYVTAETRVKVCEMQREYPSVVAVHTDSVIASSPLPFAKSTALGSWDFEISGYGAVVGCGIYQIGEKTALRGTPSKQTLLSLVSTSGRVVSIPDLRVNTWRQTLANGWSLDRINRFEDSVKGLRPDSDRKRLWLDDYRTWREVTRRDVLSVPFYYRNGRIA